MPPYVPPDPVAADARRQLIITVAFIVAALVMSYLPSGGKEIVASALRSSVLRPFLGLNELVVAARQRTLDVEVLQARLDSATARLLARTTLEEENRRLRAMLELEDRTPVPWLAAQVVRPGTQGSESTFLLNVGARDGVPPQAPIVTREGLAGRILEVRDGSSIGMDWTHPDFGATAMSRDGAVFGIVETRRGRFREEDRLILTGTPYHTRLEPGTEIVTSGTGGVFPRGIVIGRVVELAEAEGGWITSYWLQPYVQPGEMAQVLVVMPQDSLGAAPPVLGMNTDSTGARLDLSALWPPGETGTRTERWDRERARQDSLATLRREVETLRDSLRAARGGVDTLGAPSPGPAGGGA